MTAPRRKAGVTALACLGLGFAVTLTAPAAFTTTASAAAPSVTRADFNGDGYADLVVGTPLEDVGTIRDAGAVQVFYGAAGGVPVANSTVVQQDVSGALDTAEAGDHFGQAVAIGDFNADSFADLAVGVPYEDINNVVDAGAVQVFYGSRSGLVVRGNQLLTQGGSGVADRPETNDRFGLALAAGNVAGSSQTDLAVGVPFEDVGSDQDAGAVQILRGSATGLTTAENQLVTQDTSGVADSAEDGDRFGAALATGNLSGSSQADLAVGVPFENVGGTADAGAVHVFRGSATGPSIAGDKLVTQNSKGANDSAEKGDHFGAALAVGNLAGTSYGDLAVGVPLENVGSAANAGAVHVLRGAKAGLTTAGDQVITQNSKAILDKAEKNDRFGSAVAVANLGGSSYADLAVGVPLENVVAASDAGAVNVVRGARTGLSGAGDQFVYQSSRGSESASERNDHFGATLAAANLAGNGFADLAVGVPLENVGSSDDGGSVQVVRGSSSGLTFANDQVITQSNQGAPSSAETNDRFGSAVAAG